MTWGPASTAVVAGCVAAALWWFERSRPSPREVALIAAMAALAVAGRLAFAPFPGVKPSTDIILLAGLAFGITPGFVVGAMTALVSNVAFGFGVDTPWQMLAWGAVGAGGALLAPLLGRRPNRWLLAAVCMLASWAFSAFMDLSVWAQTAPGHTLSDYAAIAARGIPFTLAHVIGSAVFALLFGRVLLTGLRRARARAVVVWNAPPPLEAS
jgi:energy-coupling factor transport system substrate-specific component